MSIQSHQHDGISSFFTFKNLDRVLIGVFRMIRRPVALLPRLFSIKALWTTLMLWLVLNATQSHDAWADTLYHLALPEGKSISLDALNTNRGDNMIVLYDSTFGATTRSNGFGVEVIARRIPASDNRPYSNGSMMYRVIQVKNVWECLKLSPAGCGNNAIPSDGLVISAAGERRKELLDLLSEGATFEVQEHLFSESTMMLDAINPNAKNNPRGSSFPGARGSNQLLLYSRDFEKPSTGTNRFGFEVTVAENRVVKHGGADSVIPQNKGDFILSGHGKAQRWLAENAVLGSKITVNYDKKIVTSAIDVDTYRLQLQNQLEELDCVPPGKTPDRYISDVDPKAAEQLNDACQRGYLLLSQFDGLVKDNQATVVAKQAIGALKELDTLVFKQFPTLPFDAPIAVWHRPVELTTDAIITSLNEFQQAGINTIFLETFFHGYTIFPSRTFSAFNLAPNQYPKFSGFDPMAVWVAEAHKRGMKVHAWIETFYGGSRKIDNGGPILKMYPKWANVQFSALQNGQAPASPQPSTVEADHYFMDAANPEVRQFMLTLVAEMINRYPLDGIQLDYIRYASSFAPEKFSYQQTTWGYSDAARRQFIGENGLDPVSLSPNNAVSWEHFSAFKARQVSSFVQSVRLLLNQHRSKAILSVCIFPDWKEAWRQKHQDWATWANEGWVDWIVPLTLTSDVRIVTESTYNVLEKTVGSGK
jgi:hypothetical protein